MYALPTINKFYEEPLNHRKSAHDETQMIHHIFDDNKKKQRRKKNRTVRIRTG